MSGNGKSRTFFPCFELMLAFFGQPLTEEKEGLGEKSGNPSHSAVCRVGGHAALVEVELRGVREVAA